MGYYLNGRDPYFLYNTTVRSPYFVDKSAILDELVSLLDKDSRYVCVTRPRRFGKSVMANMIGAFFSRGCAAEDVFDSLQIAKHPEYRSHLNHYNVICIDFSEIDDGCARRPLLLRGRD